MTAVVVGSGFGGMAAALRLRAKGYEVILIDRCAMLGGRAQVFEWQGFRHDAGPTVITAPFLIAELFTLFGERMDDYLDLVPVKPWYRFHFSDGDTFDYGGTLEDTLAEIGRLEPADRDGYVRLLAHSKRIFDAGFTDLSSQPFHRLGTMLAQVPRLLRLRSDKTVWRLVSSYIRRYHKHLRANPLPGAGLRRALRNGRHGSDHSSARRPDGSPADRNQAWRDSQSHQA